MLNEHDHRQIGREQDLFHFQEEAPGMAFWHPRGLLLCRVLEHAARDALEAQDYAEVRAPQVLRQPIWQASGHWQHFAEGIFKLEEDDGQPSALRPVNCPGHVQIYAHALRSHRDLPLRLAEFGVVHRKEPSGALQGLFRLRQFMQDDGHIFCRADQLADEVSHFCRGLRAFYQRFGFAELGVGLSLRPAARLGSDAEWDVAEHALRNAALGLGFELKEQPGEGAFYGPKLEFKLRDRLQRSWQCGTIQLDFNMPERFALAYVDSHGQPRRPVMLHRALYGSLERFLGVLIEHHGGHWPAWLAPEQARVLAVGEDSGEYASELRRALRAAGLRVGLDRSLERLGGRVAEARRAAVPFLLCVGPREARERSVSLRQAALDRAEPSEPLGFEVAVAQLAEACARPAFAAPA
jgi:threonyl-tRNA synthetase